MNLRLVRSWLAGWLAATSCGCRQFSPVAQCQQSAPCVAGWLPASAHQPRVPLLSARHKTARVAVQAMQPKPHHAGHRAWDKGQ
ncbi:hypothetical protein BC831DRAFT_476401 [Entophlyctis helioformis]|nr:hypothetical protein BC831DRAFT_476401 [Entophlyctis helioformis]